MMRRFLPALLLLVAGSVPGFGYVMWEDYYFTVDHGTASLRRSGAVVFYADRSRVRVCDGHLLVDGTSTTPAFDLIIDSGTALAISHEFQRDAADCDRRPPFRPRPPEHPQRPPQEPPAKPVKPEPISLPAAAVVK